MLQLAAVFSDHMVLQREKNIVVFGIGEVGAIITVSIPERKLYASTTVKEDGSWRLQFPPQPAGTGLSLFAKDSHTEIHFQDVAIGEIWLAGGQSNMEFPVKNAVNGKLELSHCERSRVRYYHVQRSGQPPNTVQHTLPEIRSACCSVSPTAFRIPPAVLL